MSNILDLRTSGKRPELKRKNKTGQSKRVFAFFLIKEASASFITW